MGERFEVMNKDWYGFYKNIDIENEIAHQAVVHDDLIKGVTSLSANSVLEVGSGSASISFSIAKAKKGLGITTVDNRPEILSKIIKDANKLGLNIKTICADAFNLPFSDNAYDVVFSQGVLEHFKDSDIKKLVDEKLRVCSKSVFISVPNNYYNCRDFGDERLLSKQQWDKILSGFNIAESGTYYYIRAKRNFFRRLPVMYMCRIDKEK